MKSIQELTTDLGSTRQRKAVNKEKKRQRRKEKGVFKSMRLKSEKKMVYLQADKCTLEKTLIAKVEKVVPQ